MDQMSQIVRRQFEALPGPVRAAYAWVAVVTAMTLAVLALTAASCWMLGIG